VAAEPAAPILPPIRRSIHGHLGGVDRGPLRPFAVGRRLRAPRERLCRARRDAFARRVARGGGAGEDGDRARRPHGRGSLIVGDAAAGGTPGNMFVPTDGLHPILGDLLAAGRVSGPGRPWLGVAVVRGALVVGRVTPGGPAEQAGVRAGGTIVAVNGETVGTLAAFYRKVWAQGGAGAVVTLELSRNDETRRIEVRSMNRLDHLRLKSSL